MVITYCMNACTHECLAVCSWMHVDIKKISLNWWASFNKSGYFSVKKSAAVNYMLLIESICFILNVSCSPLSLNLWCWDNVHIYVIMCISHHQYVSFEHWNVPSINKINETLSVICLFFNCHETADGGTLELMLCVCSVTLLLILSFYGYFYWLFPVWKQEFTLISVLKVFIVWWESSALLQ